MPVVRRHRSVPVLQAFGGHALCVASGGNRDGISDGRATVHAVGRTGMAASPAELEAASRRVT
jgi:hypothetical protein